VRSQRFIKKTNQFIDVYPNKSLVYGDTLTIQAIYKALSYKETIWIKQFGKIRPKIIHGSYLKKEHKTTLEGTEIFYSFYSGLLPLVQQSLPDLPIQYHIPKVKTRLPKLKNITFRDYQKRAIRKAIKYKRGIIFHPTGTGKSIVFLGIVSAIKGNILILCHSTDIIKQIYTDAIKFNFKDCLLLDANNYKLKNKHSLIISTIQTFKSRMTKQDYKYFDCIIVDECHRISNMYSHVLEKLEAPIRIGLTGTLPTNSKRKLLVQSLLGKIIDKLTPKQAEKKEILSKAKVKIIKVPICLNEIKKGNYQEIYHSRIIHNHIRNSLIVNKAIELQNQNKSCLILIKNIQHGINIQENFKLNGFNVPFLSGNSKSNTRILTKNNLLKKHIKTLITSVIFLTGVNIPSLDCIIMALGDKSEIQVIQAAGRCLRKTETKSKAQIIDFLDSGKYLKNHSLSRIKTYKKQGWEIYYE